MSPERYKRLSTLFEQVHAEPREQWLMRLEQISRTDPDLVPELKRMLAKSSGGALDGPLDIPQFTEGQLVGQRFRVIKRIGRGGMGEVYKVEDTQLKGVIAALKTIRPDAALDPGIVKRFEREVSLSRMVTHQNVCRVYDFGIHRAEGDTGTPGSGFVGTPFMTMEFLEGSDLHSRIDEGPIPHAEALQWALQILAGLKAAHDKGVVHRDLKPSNILLCRENDGSIRPVIADFGVAHGLSNSGYTQSVLTGFAQPGTPVYMPREQATGGEPSPLWDIYALGLIMHEMLTGSRPSAGVPIRLTYVPYPERVNWETAILACIDPEPAARPRNVTEIVALLTRPASTALAAGPPESVETSWATAVAASSGGGVSDARYTHTARVPVSHPAPLPVPAEPATPAPPLSRRYAAPVGAALAVAAIIGFGYSRWTRSEATDTRVVPSLPTDSILRSDAMAVLPFAYTGPAEYGYLAPGISDGITAKLMRMPSVRVPLAAAVREVAKQPPKDAARTLGVRFVVTGGTRVEEGVIRVETNIYDHLQGKETKREFTTSLASFVGLEEDILKTLAQVTGVKRTPATERPLTASTEAYDLYLRAKRTVMDFKGKQDLNPAVDQYRKALKIDPKFAAAYAAMGDAYMVLYRETKEDEWANKALQSALQARELNPELPEAHYSLGSIYTRLGKTDEATQELKRAIELNPNSPDGYRRLGRAYQDGGSKLDSLTAFERAVAINPNYWNNHYQLGGAYLKFGETEKALRALEQARQLSPNRALVHELIGSIHARAGRYAQAIEAYQAALAIEKHPVTLSNLAAAYCSMRRFNEALVNLKAAVDLSPKNEVLVGNLADVYRWTGKQNDAKKTYAKAIELAHADLKVNPNAAGKFGSLALYHAKTGASQDALRFIERARSLDPSDTELVFSEAVVQTLVGPKTAAIGAVKEALARGNSADRILAEPDFDKIAKEPEFLQLIAGARSAK